MTEISFEQRWTQHRLNFEHPEQSQMALYHSGLKYEDLTFEVMIDFNELKANEILRSHDYKCIEMGLIAYFKPRLNISGVKIPYRFK